MVFTPEHDFGLLEPHLVLLLVRCTANFHLFGDKLLNLFNKAQRSLGSSVVTPSAVRATPSAVRAMVSAVRAMVSAVRTMVSVVVVAVTRAVRKSAAVIEAVFCAAQLMTPTWRQQQTDLVELPLSPFNLLLCQYQRVAKVKHPD